MYRESLALAIHRHNPDFEVMIADPATMDGGAERFGPHALIRDDGIEVGSPDGVVCWAALDKAAKFVSETASTNGTG